MQTLCTISEIKRHSVSNASYTIVRHSKVPILKHSQHFDTKKSTAIVSYIRENVKEYKDRLPLARIITNQAFYLYRIRRKQVRLYF